MEKYNEVLEQVTQMINQVCNKNITSEELSLSSFDTLKLVLLIEKQYKFNIEDNVIFRGLFESKSNLCNYILEKIGAE